MCPQKFTATLVIVDVFLLLFSYKSGYCKNLYVNTYVCFKHFMCLPLWSQNSYPVPEGHGRSILILCFYQRGSHQPELGVSGHTAFLSTFFQLCISWIILYIYSLSGFFCWTLCFRDSSRFVHISLIHFHWMCNPSIWMHHNFSIHSITDRRFHYF